MLEFRAAVESWDTERMEAALAPGVTFRSPAVFQPYHGREAVMHLLRTVLEVFEDFRYTDELQGDGTHALIFRATAGGKEVEGLDHLTTDADGLITQLVVMVRPLSGLMALAQEMGSRLEANPVPSA